MMPLVISHKSKRTHYVRSEEVLGEILGHSNFDDEDWAIGDVIVFEDGTVSEIEKHPDGPFHVWSDPTSGTLQDVVTQIRKYGDSRIPPEGEVASWERLFHLLAKPLPKMSWWRRILN